MDDKLEAGDGCAADVREFIRFLSVVRDPVCFRCSDRAHNFHGISALRLVEWSCKGLGFHKTGTPGRVRTAPLLAQLWLGRDHGLQFSAKDTKTGDSRGLDA